MPPPLPAVLVTSFHYDPLARAAVTTDPEGVRTCRDYDDAGRLVRLVEDCPSATSSSSSSSSGGFSGAPASVDVRTTHYRCTPDGWLRELESENAATGTQITEWEYGVTTAQGSALNSNRLVRRKIYPGGGSDEVTYECSRQLQVTKSDRKPGELVPFSLNRLRRRLHSDFRR